jgi:hypothetical protein
MHGNSWLKLLIRMNLRLKGDEPKLILIVWICSRYTTISFTKIELLISISLLWTKRAEELPMLVHSWSRSPLG